MASSVCAVYPGTFDPMTLGHVDVIARGAGLFSSVVVAVAAAHHKKTLFSLDERLALARACVADYPNVRVQSFSGLLVQFVAEQGARVVLRGVRSGTDFDYETQLAGMNRALAPQFDTVFLPADARFQHVSSTMVREVATLGGDASAMLAPPVWQALQRKLTTP